MVYYIDGDVGYGVLGRGLNKVDFLMEYDVLFVVNILDGIVVIYWWDFGDGILVEMKKINVLYCYFSLEGFVVIVEVNNFISDVSVSCMIRIMKSIFNVLFENDSLIVYEFNIMLFIMIG